VDAADLIAQLEALLTEERAAIVRLDGAAVEALAYRKKELAESLERRPKDERARLAGPVKRLVTRLRHNGVLLLQARAILSEVLMGPGVTMPRLGASTVHPTAPRAARHLSVRG